MSKNEFLSALRKKLSGLPRQDVEERLGFYSEMIDDRVEEGLSEKEAVLQIGSVDEIASQIIGSFPLSKLVKERIKSNRTLRAWEIILLAVGSPIWLSLLVASFAVIISLYASLWSVVVSLWAVFAAIVISSPSGIAVGIVFAFGGNLPFGLVLISSGVVLAGVAIIFFWGCKWATVGAIWLTKKIIFGIKKLVVRRERI